jgi:hypothetical protein
MKMLNVSFVLFFLSTTLVFSQTITTYDFKTKVPSTIGTVPLGQNAIYKIENINTLLYDVKIESKQADFHSEPPSIFGQIFKLEEVVKATAGKELESTVESMTDKTTSTQILNGSKEQADLFLNEKIIENYKTDLKEEKSKNASLQDSSKIAELDEKIKRMRNEIAAQKTQLESLKIALSDEYAKILKELLYAAMNVSNSFDLLENSKLLKNKLVNLSLSDGLTYKQSFDAAEKILAEFEFANALNRLPNDFEKDYRKFLLIYDLYLKSEVVKNKFGSDSARIKKSVEGILIEMQAIKTVYDKSNYQEVFKGIDKLRSVLSTEKYYSVVSDPVQANKDIVSFTITVSPRKDTDTPKNLETRNFS